MAAQAEASTFKLSEVTECKLGADAEAQRPRFGDRNSGVDIGTSPLPHRIPNELLGNVRRARSFLQWPSYPADVLHEITMVASAAKQALFTEWIDRTTPFTYFDGMEALAESTRIPVGVPFVYTQQPFHVEPSWSSSRTSRARWLRLEPAPRPDRA